MSGSYFGNYQTVKLALDGVEAQNLLLLGLFFALILITTRKGEPTSLLSPRQSLQLRGFVSMLVVIGHLWTHVAREHALLVSHGETVFMFLFLSGFGLTISFRKGHTDAGWFAKRRLIRVMIPYWIITAILLPLDWFLLGRGYSVGELAMTIAGINTTVRLNHIDYGRWYVTFLLVWYALFFLSYHILRGKRSGWVLFAGSLLLFFVYRQYAFAHQFFAFPLGCLVAERYTAAATFFKRYERLLLHGAGTIILFVVLFKMLILPWLYLSVPYAAGPFLLLQEGENLLFALALCIIMGAAGARGYESRLLVFCGTVSYEVFLIHGALLIKYNPVFPLLTEHGIIPAFLLWVVFLYGATRLINRLFVAVV
jgi:membrane-bound acyltransferase YfiQ involved in biofilm formation